MDHITIIGLVAAFFTTISFVPQAIKTIKSKDTKDISLPMYIFYTIAGILWLVYGVMTKGWPIIASNVITLVFASIILVYKLKYK